MSPGWHLLAEIHAGLEAATIAGHTPQTIYIGPDEAQMIADYMTEQNAAHGIREPAATIDTVACLSLVADSDVNMVPVVVSPDVRLLIVS
jgi:hypothetical protein